MKLVCKRVIAIDFECESKPALLRVLLRKVYNAKNVVVEAQNKWDSTFKRQTNLHDWI
jgi:hypothetical protein